jgi:ferredoxin
MGLIMKAIVKDTCIACGLCIEICPEVFQMGPQIAEVIADPIPQEAEETAQQAATDCPVEAIEIK